MAGHHRTSTGTLAPASAAGAPDGRAHPRHGNVLRVGVLVRAGGARQLCLVRDVGADGVAIRLSCEVAPGEAVAIELQPGRAIAGRIAWARGGHAGIRFEPPVKAGEVVAAPGLQPGWRPRAPGHAVERLAMIRAGSDISFASTRDVSADGACLVCERPIEEGTPIVLTLEGCRPLDGVVCWNRRGLCGISFDRPIPPGDLGRWIGS